ncbi:MAG: xanthine dehydrogenase family protein molybdopterin-binding subunit, partial [Acidimicrobiia bacterium]
MTAVMGSPRVRKEDPALLTGENKFVDDIQVAGQLWMGMVRSPFAHAKINGINTEPAKGMPGVHAVYSGAELMDMGLWAGPLPCAWPVTPDMVNPPHYPVASGEVHHVGEIVAVVLADSRYEAADAAEMVEVDYDALDAVGSIDAAMADGTKAHSDLESNKAFTWALEPNPDGVNAAFDGAAHTVTGEFIQQRLIPSAMEPRGVLAVPSPHGGDITMY